MGANSKIEWTDATWNPIRARTTDHSFKIGWHCEHVSPGCEHCYAEGMNKRLGTGLPFKPGHRADLEIFLDEKMLLAPLHLKKPRDIFVCSMTDAMADFVKDEWLDRMFAVMALTPQHRYQVLTKRPARMQEYITVRHEPRARLKIAGSMNMMGAGATQPIGYRGWPLPNVWLGVSAEDQQRADERIPLLLATPAAVRFVSLEPLLGPITLWHIDEDEGGLRGPGVKISGGMTVSTPDNPPEGYDDSQPWLDWVIIGGESGPKARPMHPDWARSLRDQCAAAGVPFFFKQWGEHAPYDRGRVNSAVLATPKSLDEPTQRFGKKLAGRLLDGVEHNGMPA